MLLKSRILIEKYSASQPVIYKMQKLTFSELVQGKPSFPREEEKIIDYWRKIDAFKTQLEKSKNNKPFTFYDGPPFATGKPRMFFILVLYLFVS